MCALYLRGYFIQLICSWNIASCFVVSNCIISSLGARDTLDLYTELAVLMTLSNILVSTTGFGSVYIVVSLGQYGNFLVVIGLELSLRFPVSAFTSSAVAPLAANTFELGLFILFGKWIILRLSSLTLVSIKVLCCSQNPIPELITGLAQIVLICARFCLVIGPGRQLDAWQETLKNSFMTCK